MTVNQASRRTIKSFCGLFFSAAALLNPLYSVVAAAQDEANEAAAESGNDSAEEKSNPSKTSPVKRSAPAAKAGAQKSDGNKEEAKEESTAAATGDSEMPAAKAPAVIKPWKLETEPLFKGPTVKRFEHIADLTARNKQLLENLDYRPSGTALRLNQIRKLSLELKKAPPKSEQAVTATLGMLRLYEEQALVFEWMRIVGAVDPKYPDLGQTLKNIRRQQAQRYYDLILNYPKHPNVKQWKFNQLVARLRLGDPSVREEALTLMRTSAGTEARELMAVGVAVDAAAGRLPSPFGTPEAVIQNSIDRYETAAFKLLIAERELSMNKIPQAITTLQEVITTTKAIRLGGNAGKEQTPGTILQAASSMLITAGLRNLAAINQDVVQTFINNDLLEYARSYLEQYAMLTYSKNLVGALKAYVDAVAIGIVPEDIKMKAEVRMLDINIASNDNRMIVLAWERVIVKGIQKAIPLESQLMQTINLVYSKFRTKPDKDSISNFVGVHDIFARGFPFYAAREDYALRVLEALFQGQMHAEVIKRSELAIARFKDKMNRISAFNFNLKSRSHMMGLGANFKFLSNVKISGEPTLVTGYIENCDKLRSILPPHESEQYLYLSAYVQLLAGPMKVSLARYEEAFSKFPRNPNASESAAALLEVLTQRREFADVEKFVRLFMKLAIIPSRDPNKDLPRVLERTVIDSAKLFFETKKFDQAAARFVAFQKEFPLSALAPFALEKAGASFGQINKVDQALSAYELYLKTYPKLPAAKDIRWAAAEMSATAKLYLKAAEHYQQFNIFYPVDGVQKSASLKAAENFRLAGKFADAVNEYEKYLKTVKLPAEQMRVLRLISASAVKASNGAVALNALERLSKLVRQPDEVIGVQFELMTVYQKLGKDDLSRKAAGVIVASKPSTPEGFKYQAKARFIIGRFDAPALRARQIMSQKDLKVALQSLFTEYEKVKASLLSPCEIPGVDWCVLGYYEASRLAGDLGKMLLNVEPSNYLDENVVAEIKSLVSWNRDKMKSEARSFALQAEDSLASSNLQEAEVVDKIKIYIEQVKSSSQEGEQTSDAGAGGGDF